MEVHGYDFVERFLGAFRGGGALAELSSRTAGHGRSALKTGIKLLCKAQTATEILKPKLGVPNHHRAPLNHKDQKDQSDPSTIAIRLQRLFVMQQKPGNYSCLSSPCNSQHEEAA